MHTTAKSPSQTSVGKVRLGHSVLVNTWFNETTPNFTYNRYVFQTMFSDTKIDITVRFCIYLDK